MPKRCVLCLFWKDSTERADFTDSDKLFNTTGPKKLKAHSPNALSLGIGLSKMFFEEERRGLNGVYMLISSFIGFWL